MAVLKITFTIFVKDRDHTLSSQTHAASDYYGVINLGIKNIPRMVEHTRHMASNYQHLWKPTPCWLCSKGGIHVLLSFAHGNSGLSRAL